MYAQHSYGEVDRSDECEIITSCRTQGAHLLNA